MTMLTIVICYCFFNFVFAITLNVTYDAQYYDGIQAIYN